MTVGERIKLYMVENKIRQNDIAEITKIAPSKLNASLNGNRNLPMEELELILGALDLEPNKVIIPRKR